ncbi:hypothetical protein DFH09DRAFT_140959 [Mycena vulgaris]|nr:hypothetical protein DFH09DRAFT_140959 [Mycena vulgaris]
MGSKVQGSPALFLARQHRLCYTTSSNRRLAEINSPPVKYVVWSGDGALVVLMSKHTITIANKNFRNTVSSTRPSASSLAHGTTPAPSFTPPLTMSNTASPKVTMAWSAHWITLYTSSASRARRFLVLIVLHG